MWRVLTVVACLGLQSIANAGMTNDEFISKYLKQPVENKVLWLNKPLQQRAATILGHNYQGLRVRYWQSGNRSAWILDEIGKEQPITTGIVVENNQIVAVDVLVYRESRGGEVQQNFFTKQFEGLTLDKNDKLSKKIDGITGATLSVWALQKVARLALMFDSQKGATP